MATVEQKPEMPDLKKIVWQKVVKWIGNKWAIGLFVGVGIIGLMIEIIPGIQKTYSTIEDSFKKTYPAKPKFEPQNFTLGLFIINDTGQDPELSKWAKIKFQHLPDFAIHDIKSFTLSVSKNISNNWQLAEKEVIEWMSTTGASGVLWGEKIFQNGKTKYLLNWSRPPVQDLIQEAYVNWVSNPTTIFPPLDEEQAELLISVYLKETIKQQNDELGRPEDNSPPGNSR